MVAANDGCFGYIWMIDRGILNIDRANPFAAGFDDILGTIDELDEALGVDLGDVAGP